MNENEEVLVREIQETISKLNKLVTKAIYSAGLKVEINYFPNAVIGYTYGTPNTNSHIVSCKIYKEII